VARIHRRTINKDFNDPDNLNGVITQVEPEMLDRARNAGYGTMDWLKLGKEYIKAVYCHPAYLTYM